MAQTENNTDQSAVDAADFHASDTQAIEDAGSALQIAREAKNMTVEDAARQLRLGTHQILALEQDNFAKLPNAMITRGFLRNYARLLDIDAAPLLLAYRLKMPDTGQTKLSLTSEHIAIKNTNKKSYLAYLFIALVVILGSAAWWLYVDENKSPINSTTDQVVVQNTGDTPVQSASVIGGDVLPPQALPAAERLAEANNTAIPPAVDTVTTPKAVVPETPKPVVTTLSLNRSESVNTEMAKPETTKSENTKLEVMKPGYQSMQLKANKETWLQVQNTAGVVLHERIIAAGGIENFDFKPPAKVIVGNATGAQLFYKNQSIDLLSRAKNNVARITLD